MNGSWVIVGLASLAGLGAVACEGGVAAGGGGGGSGSGGLDLGTATSKDSTLGVLCDYAHDAYNASASVKARSTVTWSCSATSRDMVSNDIPDHEVGTFPNASCPNTIAPADMTVSIPLAPRETGSTVKLGIVGFAYNGVKLDPATAGSCDGAGSCTLIGNTGTFSIEALGQTSFDFGVDANNAHVQPTGEYHYHGMPEGLVAAQGDPKRPVFVGFALDGFPIYARYGYAEPLDASSELRVLRASYALKNQPDAGRPSTTSYPMGTFTQDWQYVEGAGDLDECNGRFGVTPEFPQGIYHYTITDTYPFIQRCVKGTPSKPSEQGGGSGGPPGGGPPPMSGSTTSSGGG